MGRSKGSPVIVTVFGILGLLAMATPAAAKLTLSHRFLAENKLDGIGIEQLLTMVSGVIKIGNKTITLPDDLPLLMGGGSAAARSQRQGGGGGGGGWGGWAEPTVLEVEESNRRSGLLSVENFFRVGCILFDLSEIKKSAHNGVY